MLPPVFPVARQRASVRGLLREVGALGAVSSLNRGVGMDNLQDLIAKLAQIGDDGGRSTFIREHPQLTTLEGARLLCRTSVALTSRDLVQAERLCDTLDVVASLNSISAVCGYRAHARAAHFHQAGTDLRQAVALWVTAIECFEAAGLPHEVAISSSCAVSDSGSVGNLQLAWECESRARSYFEATGDRLRLARLRLNVSSIFYARAEWSTAALLIDLSRQDLIAERYGVPELVTILTNLSACYVHLGEVPHASYLLEKANELCKERRLDPDLVKISANLTLARLLGGDLLSTIELIAQQLKRSPIGTRLYYLAALNEAEVLLDLCLPAQAYQKAFSAHEGLERIGSCPESARALLVCGRCLTARRHFPAAIQTLDRAQAFFSAVGSTQGERLCSLEKAKALLDMGAVQESATLLNDVVSSATTSWVEMDLDCLLLQARVRFAQGQLTEARRVAEGVVARSSLAAYNGLEGRALRLLADVYEALGLVDFARDVLFRSQRSIDSLRRTLPTGELQMAFLTDKNDVYQSLFCLGLKSGEPAERLLRLVEASKSRALTESLALQLSPETADVEEPAVGLFQVWGGLSATLNQLDTLERTLELQFNPIRRGVVAAERATRGLLRGVTNSEFTEDCEDLPSPHDIASSLPQHSCLVEFYAARGQLFAFVLYKGSLHLAELGATSVVQHLTRLALFSLRGIAPAGHYRQDDALLDYLEDLYGLLWSKIAPIVTDARVVIVPHGFLHQFPFHALFDGQCFLADRHAITYSPSASVFCMTRNRPQRHSRGSFVIGDPDPSVPAVADEVREVAAILPDARVFTPGAATRAQLVGELSSARFIHVAGHGRFDSSHPHSSSVCLDGGAITVRELQHMELAAQLVVLSGCETGRTALRGCDELVGLTQALLQAGARSTLVTLWRVADRATAVFMRYFCERLSDNVGRDESLKQAITLQKREFPHPSLWAPFVLVGDPGPIASQHSLAGQDLEQASHDLPGSP